MLSLVGTGILYSYLLSLVGINYRSNKQIYRGYLFFSETDRNLFHRVDTIGDILTSGAATSENITDGVHDMK